MFASEAFFWRHVLYNDGKLSAARDVTLCKLTIITKLSGPSLVSLVIWLLRAEHQITFYMSQGLVLCNWDYL